MAHRWLRPNERAIAAFDIGTRQYAACVIAYTPAVPGPKPPKPTKTKKRTIDEMAGSAPQPSPLPPVFAGTPEHVRVLSWRLLDLELDRVVAAYDAAETGDGHGEISVVAKKSLPKPATGSKGYKLAHNIDIFTSLGRHLANWNALIDTRAACYVENQGAEREAGRVNPLMVTVSKATISAISAADAAAGYTPRAVVEMAAGKEGMKRASTKTPGVSYTARKEKSDELGHEALGYYGDTGAMAFVRAVQAGGWDTDDFMDALNIARRKARETYRKRPVA